MSTTIEIRLKNISDDDKALASELYTLQDKGCFQARVFIFKKFTRPLRYPRWMLPYLSSLPKQGHFSFNHDCNCPALVNEEKECICHPSISYLSDEDYERERQLTTYFLVRRACEKESEE